MLAQFRNNYNPRIAVTVDMIATGTDVKPLECLLFMRDVKSRNYFEQMKGRGTRVIESDDLKKVTPSAIAKTHYVIVDAVGVTKSLKTASQPLITKSNVPLKDLATGVMMGVREKTRSVRSLGALRVSKGNLTTRTAKASGTSPAVSASATSSTASLRRSTRIGSTRRPPQLPRAPSRPRRSATRHATNLWAAANVFTGPLINLLDGIRREKEQTIDHDNLDK